MTARADEVQCACHWGSPAELALLKAPDVPLAPDLLRRTWDAPDWADHGAVLRRILPQFAGVLVDGEVKPTFGMYEVGRSFARGHWQLWPTRQSSAGPGVPARMVGPQPPDPAPTFPSTNFSPCAPRQYVHGGPWLAVWESLDDEVPDRHLAEAVTAWEYGLLGDQLPGTHGTTRTRAASAASSPPASSATRRSRLRTRRAAGLCSTASG